MKIYFKDTNETRDILIFNNDEKSSFNKEIILLDFQFINNYINFKQLINYDII